MTAFLEAGGLFNEARRHVLLAMDAIDGALEHCNRTTDRNEAEERIHKALTSSATVASVAFIGLVDVVLNPLGEEVGE